MFVWIAEADTRSFNWRGSGFTEDEARASVREAWLAHARALELDPGYLGEDDINVFRTEVGAGSRDWQVIRPAPASKADPVAALMALMDAEGGEPGESRGQRQAWTAAVRALRAQGIRRF